MEAPVETALKQAAPSPADLSSFVVLVGRGARLQELPAEIGEVVPIFCGFAKVVAQRRGASLRSTPPSAPGLRIAANR